MTDDERRAYLTALSQGRCAKAIDTLGQLRDHLEDLGWREAASQVRVWLRGAEQLNAKLSQELEGR